MNSIYEVHCTLPTTLRSNESKLWSAVRDLSLLLRASPTIPASEAEPSSPCAEALRTDIGISLPAKHCAFAGCSFAAASAEDLQAHLKAQHETALETAASLLPVFSTTSKATRGPQAATQQWMLKLQSAYNEAVAVKLRESAPLAGLSIDRRCLCAYEKNLQ